MPQLQRLPGDSFRDIFTKATPADYVAPHEHLSGELRSPPIGESAKGQPEPHGYEWEVAAGLVDEIHFQ